MYRVSFIILYCNQQLYSYIIKVYITTVSLCNLHSYMFRHFLVIIRQFTTNDFLLYSNILFNLFVPTLLSLVGGRSSFGKQTGVVHRITYVCHFFLPVALFTQFILDN
jgi:hypothetical protein